MQNEKFFCPCPWFDFTTEGCRGCNEILECEVYADLTAWEAECDEEEQNITCSYFDGDCNECPLENCINDIPLDINEQNVGTSFDEFAVIITEEFSMLPERQSNDCDFEDFEEIIKDSSVPF